MELQTTRQDVAINEIVFDENIEQALDTDFTLPDYCPDVSRILKCRLTPRITSKTVSAGVLSLEGTANAHLIYSDEEGEIRSFESPVTFTKSVHLSAQVDAAMSLVNTKVDYVNCRAVTERRVEIHAALTLGIKVTAKRAVEIITDADGAGTQLLRDLIPASSGVADTEKTIIISEELEVDENRQAVRNIVRSDVRAVLSETKIISNKVILKGELHVTALYCGSDDGCPQHFESVLPLSQIIDVDGITESCTSAVTLDVISCELRPRTNMDGEARTIALTTKINCTVEAFCNSDIPVLYDAYSTEFEMECQRSDIPVEKNICEINETYLCKKTIEVSPDAVSEIVDIWCDSFVNSVRAEESSLVVSGNVTICLLAKDSAGAPTFTERPVDYEYRYDLGAAPGFIRCYPRVEALAADYSPAEGENLEVRVELSVTAGVFELNRTSVITGINILEENPKPKNEASLIIYYADEGENIWEIARHYNTSVEEVMAANSLSARVLPENLMLLIPSV